MATVIDFENLPDGYAVTNQYQSAGVTFNGGEIDRVAGVAHSREKYLRGPSTEWHVGLPLTLHFPSGADTVKLYAGASPTFPGSIGMLLAYDFTNHPIPQNPKVNLPGPRLIGDKCETLFSVSAGSSIIGWVTFVANGVDQSGNAVDPIQVIDDLEFEVHEWPTVDVFRFEHSLSQHILQGIHLGERGVILTPHGPRPVPPIGPEERAILAAFVANGLAQMIGDVESRRALQHAALSIIVREARRLSESL